MLEHDAPPADGRLHLLKRAASFTPEPAHSQDITAQGRSSWQLAQCESSAWLPRAGHSAGGSSPRCSGNNAVQGRHNNIWAREFGKLTWPCMRMPSYTLVSRAEKCPLAPSVCSLAGSKMIRSASAPGTTAPLRGKMLKILAAAVDVSRTKSGGVMRPVFTSVCQVTCSRSSIPCMPFGICLHVPSL